MHRLIHLVALFLAAAAVALPAAPGKIDRLSADEDPTFMADPNDKSMSPAQYSTLYFYQCKKYNDQGTTYSRMSAEEVRDAKERLVGLTRFRLSP